jgi:hypothetical protein
MSRFSIRSSMVSGCREGGMATDTNFPAFLSTLLFVL